MCDSVFSRFPPTAVGGLGPVCEHDTVLLTGCLPPLIPSLLAGFPKVEQGQGSCGIASSSLLGDGVPSLSAKSAFLPPKKDPRQVRKAIKTW